MVCWCSVSSFEFINVKIEFHLSLVRVHHDCLYLISCVRMKSGVVLGTAGFFQVGDDSTKCILVQEHLLNGYM